MRSVYTQLIHWKKDCSTAISLKDESGESYVKRNPRLMRNGWVKQYSRKRKSTHKAARESFDECKISSTALIRDSKCGTDTERICSQDSVKLSVVQVTVCIVSKNKSISVVSRKIRHESSHNTHLFVHFFQCYSGNFVVTSKSC